MKKQGKPEIKSLLNRDELKAAAEKIARSRSAGQKEFPGDDANRELNENLHIYQIELEMQNQGLQAAQEELEQSRLKYFRLFDLAPIGYITLDREGIIKEINLKAAEMLGKDRRTIKDFKTSLFSFIRSDSMGVLRKHLNDVFGSQQAHSCLIRFKAHLNNEDNEEEMLTVHLHSTIGADSSGKDECLSSLIDVTERVRFEENLRDSERRFRHLFEHQSVGVAFFNYDSSKKVFVLKDINEAGCLLAKRDKLKLVGTDFLKVFPGFASSGVLKTLNIVYHENQPGVIKKFHYSDSYNEYWANLSFFRLPLGDVVVMIEDITERVTSEEKLKKAMEESDAANKAKSLFLANMSHEIRTPMNVIMGITELLHDAGLNEEQKEYASIVKDSADYLLTIVNDILDFSKIEADRLDLTKTVFNLPEELKHAVGSFARIADRKGIRIDYARGNSLPAYVIGDSTRLNQVLNNLIGNALKYTPEGKVGISVDLIDAIPDTCEQGPAETTEEERCFIRFRVSDTGIGIPSDKQHLVFQSFMQIEQAGMSKQDGTGLGLAIAKTLVDLMGGKIWFESEPGRGSEFTFTLPFIIPTENEIELYKQESKKLPAEPGESLKLLLVEDKLLNRRLATAFLEKLGHKVVTAANGRLAVEMVFKDSFDAVLMDINMPEMDGIKATRAIRARETREDRQRIPIIAMTAYAMKGDREKCIEAGMDDYISKPFKSEELHNILNLTLSGSRSLENREACPPAEDKENIQSEITSIWKKVDGNKVLLDELVGMLLNDYHQEMGSLEQALADNDLERATSVMHGLKGQFGSLGLDGAFQLTRDIEAMLKKQDLTGVLPMLNLLRKKVDRLEAFFADPTWPDKISN